MLPDNIKELRQICVKYGLPVYGTKLVLKTRLLEQTELGLEEQVEEVEVEEEEVVLDAKKYENMTKEELINECKKKKLTIRGNKQALLERLADYKVIHIIIINLPMRCNVELKND